MTLARSFLFTAGLLFYAFSARANTTSLRAALDLERFDYREDVAAPARSRESGLAPFLDVSFQTQALPDLRWDVDFRGLYQRGLTYEGTDLNSNADVNVTDVHSMLDLESSLHYFPMPNWRVFGGLGTHSWNRVLVYGTGYRELYTWWTASLGTALRFYQGNGFDWWGEFSVRPMVTGQMKVIFSETVTNGDDTTLNLTNKTGFRFRFPLEWELQSTQLLIVTPWYEESGFGRSDTKSNSTPGLSVAGSGSASIYEPSSRIQAMGLSIGFGVFF